MFVVYHLQSTNFTWNPKKNVMLQSFLFFWVTLKLLWGNIEKNIKFSDVLIYAYVLQRKTWDSIIDLHLKIYLKNAKISENGNTQSFLSILGGLESKLKIFTKIFPKSFDHILNFVGIVGITYYSINGIIFSSLKMFSCSASCIFST